MATLQYGDNPTDDNTLMALIDIRHDHTRDCAQSREAIEDLATQLDRKLDMAHHWEGDTLHFSRPGIQGHIAVQPRQIHVSAKLGMMMSPMKGMIEARIRGYLAEHFG